MYVEKLKLINFRNYSELNLNFDKNINIIYGDNAQGKTNILEALYFSSCARSHRSNKDKELIKWGTNETYIESVVKKEIGDVKIDIGINNEHKKDIRINSIPVKRVGELMGNLNSVMFSPEDLKLIKEGPSERRRFLDIAISQVKPNYFYSLQQYFKIIQQRNALLKDIKYNKSLIDTLSIWDNNLVEIGSKIMYYRYVFLDSLRYFFKDIHKNITNENADIKYESSVSIFENVKGIAEKLIFQLNKNIEKDILTGSTSVGPHRDDFEVLVDSIDIRAFGSQGQQRTAALALKLAEVRWFNQEINEYPILLLDDVMSELDDNRQKYLLENLNNIQVFITCTNADKYNVPNSRFYKVTGGFVSCQ